MAGLKKAQRLWTWVILSLGHILLEGTVVCSHQLPQGYSGQSHQPLDLIPARVRKIRATFSAWWMAHSAPKCITLSPVLVSSTDLPCFCRVSSNYICSVFARLFWTGGGADCVSRSELRRTLHATVQGAAAQVEPGGSQGAKKSVYVWGSNILAGQGRNPVQKVKLLQHSPYGGEGSVVNDATLLQRRIHFKLWILGNFPDTGEVCQHINHVRNGGFRLVFLYLNLNFVFEATEYHSALPERLVLNWKEMHHLQELQYPITIFPFSYQFSSSNFSFQH